MTTRGALLRSVPSVDKGGLADRIRAAELRGTDREVARLLLARHPDALGPHELHETLWPRTVPTEYRKQRRLMRLRRQLATVGVAIRFRLHVGYTIEVSDGCGRVRGRRESDAVLADPPLG
jgi:hypothetical protein